jgi:hypothetical protein
MNFLNEIAGRYPAAISFAAGRPNNRLFDRLKPKLCWTRSTATMRTLTAEHRCFNTGVPPASSTNWSRASLATTMACRLVPLAC